ncbi:MAG: GNAT family N-acetyltransferase [Chloroflexota bacterium]
MLQFAHMLAVVKYTAHSELAAEWNALRATTAVKGPFLDWEWQDLWWRTFGDGRELWLLAVRQGSDLVGIAPLMFAQGRLTFSCGDDVCDYLDILARPGYEEAVCEAVLAYLQGQDWQVIELYSLPTTAVALQHLSPLATRLGLGVETSQTDVCPVLDLPTSWEDYLATLPKKDRHELRRKLRRLGAAGQVRSYALTGGEITEQAAGDFFSLHRLSTPEKACFMTGEMEGFFRAVLDRQPENGRPRLYFLELDGKRVAATICFDYDDELLLYNSGYDPTYANLSAGLLLKAYCIEDAIGLGRSRFDFLRGDERYKYDLGGKDTPVYQLRVVRRS